MWNPRSVNFSLIEKSNNWMFGNVEVLLEHFSFPLMNVYVPSSCEDKSKVWKEISDKTVICGRDWLVVAMDFYAILDHSEKRDDICRPSKSMEDFMEFVSDNKFFDVVPKNGIFTWTNRRRISPISQNIWIDLW
ncbi:hypothetical protein SUGI_0507450 [Cryptomeria japonica]|nr:hypothetical protein SUGI_0507450 [Cryptomeria japonica]